MGSNAVSSRSVEQVLQTCSVSTQVPDRSSPKRTFKLNHLERRSIEFYLQHKSQLPEWTTGKWASGDQIIVERILGSPSLQGDHKAVNLCKTRRRGIEFCSIGDRAKLEGPKLQTSRVYMVQ